MYADFEVGSHGIESELEASTNFGRADAVGMLQAMSQVMLQGAWSVDYSLKVLKGILFLGIMLIAFGGFCSWILVHGCYACCLRGVLFLDPRSWAFYPRVFVPGVAGTMNPGSPRQSRRWPLRGFRLPRLSRGLSRVVAGGVF
jgi:hypothetical protein